MFNPLTMYLHSIGEIPLLSNDEEQKYGNDLQLFSKLKILKRIDLVGDIQEVLDLDTIFLSLESTNYREIIDLLLNFFKNKDQYKNIYEIIKTYKSLSKKLERPLNAMELKNNFNFEGGEKLDPVNLLNQIKIYIVYQTAFDKMYESNLRLVVSFAKKYVDESFELLDLINEGNLALRHAIQKFDPQKGKFSTYAGDWLENRILRYKNGNKNIIVGNYANYKSIIFYYKKILELEERIGHKLSASEISKELGIPVSKATGLILAFSGTESLDNEVFEDEDIKLEDTISDEIDIEKDYLEKKNIDFLYELLNTIKEREKQIIEYRYGFGCEKEHTLEETGLKFGITREGVRQIVKSGISKMNRTARAKSMI